eukprot:GGOE01065550.1.p1 GENE.GGOE01065550.1~~GGOE01065550.1.p1  ORF type:complete len:1034 (+),score=173.03 GGOE01065550.1:257-3103(+)
MPTGMGPLPTPPPVPAPGPSYSPAPGGWVGGNAAGAPPSGPGPQPPIPWQGQQAAANTSQWQPNYGSYPSVPSVTQPSYGPSGASYTPPPPPPGPPMAPPTGPPGPGMGYPGPSAPAPPPMAPLQSVGYSSTLPQKPTSPVSFGARSNFSPHGTTTKPSSKIDPSQIPSPTSHMLNDGRTVFHTVKHSVPPSACTYFTVVDEGSCSPQVMRPALHSAPADSDLLRDSGLLWSVLFQPLANLGTETPIPVVDFGPSGPIRCKRCRVYLNSFVHFVEQGKKWKCNFCDILNEVPHDFFCNIDADGKRRDLSQRMELSRGSVEYDVQNVAEYCFRGNSLATQKPTQDEFKPVELPLNYIFCIDISSSASLILPSIIKATEAAIGALAEQEPACNACVSFITYGSTLQFYDFTKSNMPMHVVSDMNDVFVPLPFNKVCWLNIHSDRDKITEFLQNLPSFSQSLHEPQSCVGSALIAAFLVLAESGGRVVCNCTGPPKVGMGTFKLRDDHKLYGTDTEKQLFSPIDGFWTTLATDYAKRQITLDLFCFSFAPYNDLSTLGEVCHRSGGHMDEYLSFRPQRDYERLAYALKRNLTRAAGYAGIVRVRCSRGIRVKEYDGHFLCQDPLDMDLAGIDEDKAFLVELQHDDKLDGKHDCYLQGALLYTNRHGQRRIRVHTLRMTVATTLPNLFRHADLDVTVATLCRRAARLAVRKGMPAARDFITSQCVDILTTYRKHCAVNPSPGQLILPEALKLMPIYCLGMIKGCTFRVGTDVRLDERIHDLFEIQQLTAGCSLPFIYPRLLPLHAMGAMVGNFDQDRGCIILPNTESLSSDKMNPSGIYLLHDLPTQQIFIWIGERASPKVIQYLFNSDSPELINDEWVESKSSQRLLNIIKELRRQRPQSYDAVRVIRERHDPVAESIFLSRLVEDKAGQNTWSYVEYLCHLHRNIQSKLA